jgi:hypothetical protein
MATNRFVADPHSMTNAFIRLRTCRDATLQPQTEAGELFPELREFGLGFDEVKRAFEGYLGAVGEYYERAVTCVDDLFRASLTAAIRYEKTDAEVAEFMLTTPYR